MAGSNIIIPKADIQSSVNSAGRVARLWSKTLKRSSVSRNANDSIFKYPNIASADIDTNELLTLTKALEIQIAAMVVSQISLDNVVDLKKYGSVQNWLKTIHNNSDIPANIVAMVNSATESLTNLTPEEKSDIAMECWRQMYVEEGLDSQPLNEIHKPYNETKAIIARGIKMATATEASATGPNAPNPMFGVKELRDTQVATDKLATKAGGRYSGRNTKAFNQKDTSSFGAKDFKVVADPKLGSMAPTMINVELVCHGAKDSSNSDLSYTMGVVLGVKAMVRKVTSDCMVANLVEAVKGSNRIFDFIKYTDGEIHSAFTFLNPLKQAKDIAIAANSGSKSFMKALQRRKMFNTVSKIIDNPIPPHTSIIMTSYEVARVRDITGVDLTDPYQAMKIIEKYYTLSINIYDTEAKTLMTMFDGDTEWSTNTLHSLGVANKSTVNYADLVDTAKLMNRR